MSVQVSICLPTLNSCRFLFERIESIRDQSFTDWELIAVDSHSEDGTSEMLQKFSLEDHRVRVLQTPKDGIYPNFNRGIQHAKGQFIYIATSDDTMAHDCLEKMVEALSDNPDCEIAHCPMRVIDENGELGPDWWSRSSLFAQSSGDFLNLRHKRFAPFDGILCLLGDNIYSSVTQLLIRRSLFEKIGYYSSDWGPLGDFHWNLRAGLVASTVHVPDTWGSWRMHPSQATASSQIGSPSHQAKIDAMIDDVMNHLDRYFYLQHERELVRRLNGRAGKLRRYLQGYARCDTTLERRIFLFREILSGSRHARDHIASMFPGRRRWPQAAPQVVPYWSDAGRMVYF
jgi:glycosyltransferase involved in cell wall biosynthesis